MKSSGRTPLHLWIVGTLAAGWNGFGSLDYTMTQLRHPPWLAQMTTEQRAFIDSAPYWLDATWAMGVWGGLMGALLLLARSRYAVVAFTISILGLAGNTLSQLTLPNTSPHLDSGAGLAFHAAVWAIAISLLVFALRMRGREVLR